MVWVFIVNLLIAGSAIVTLDVGPFATQEQCAAAQRVFNLTQVRENVGGVLQPIGWGKSICLQRP